MKVIQFMYIIANNIIAGLLVSSLFCLIASIIAYRRSIPGFRALTLLLLAMSVWSGSYAVGWMAVPESFKNFILHVTYIGVVAVPLMFMLFALAFAGYEKLITKRLKIVLIIEPVITLLLVLTNRYHHLIFLSINHRIENGMVWTEIVHGSWYLVNLIYSYLVISLGMAAITTGMLRSNDAAKRQYPIVLTAAMLPWLGSMVGEYYVDRIAFDITPLLFLFSAGLFSYSVIRHRFMDIISVARSRLIESMSDGVLVLDVQNRIVDINPAMQQLLNHPSSTFVGRPASEALRLWVDQTDSILNGEKTRTELRLPNSPSRYLDLRVTALLDEYQNLTGRLMVFRDVTDRKQVEKQLRLANDRLQSQLIEIGLLQSKLRSQAIRDPLTNLFNRRYLDETLDREIARAAREQYPVCVIMMDLDHFKQVNDTYGHEAGDEVLKALAATLAARNRRGDFACRFGGEEFVVVMPNIAVEVAYERAEKLRTTLNSLQIPYGKFLLSTTISMGIASYPANGLEREAILRAADRAMYSAKKAGRNHVYMYDTLEAQRHTTTAST